MLDAKYSRFIYITIVEETYIMYIRRVFDCNIN